MEIDQFRTVVRARDFDRSSRFYGDTLGLPQLTAWDTDHGRGARYQAGSGVIEIVGPARGEDADETYNYQGPRHKVEIVLLVPSAQAVYDELIFRERNIPGGLENAEDGDLVFTTHDPDGVPIQFREVAD